MLLSQMDVSELANDTLEFFSKAQADTSNSFLYLITPQKCP